MLLYSLPGSANGGSRHRLASPEPLTHLAAESLNGLYSIDIMRGKRDKNQPSGNILRSRAAAAQLPVLVR